MTVELNLTTNALSRKPVAKSLLLLIENLECSYSLFDSISAFSFVLVHLHDHYHLPFEMSNLIVPKIDMVQALIRKHQKKLGKCIK